MVMVYQNLIFPRQESLCDSVRRRRRRHAIYDCLLFLARQDVVYVAQSTIACSSLLVLVRQEHTRKSISRNLRLLVRKESHSDSETLEQAIVKH